MGSGQPSSKRSDGHFFRGHTTWHPLSAQSMVLPLSASWNMLSLEYHHQPPAECDFQMSQHRIRIALQPYHSFEHRIDEGRLFRFSVSQGGLALCPARLHHWVRWLEPAEFLLLSVQTALLDRLAEEAGLRPESLELVCNKDELQDAFILQTGLTLQSMLTQKPNSLSTLYVDALATTLAAHLLFHYCHVTGRARPSFANPTPFSSSLWGDMVEYIHTHLDEPLTLETLASVAGMSPFHFARSFKKTFGVSPHRYLLSKRIEEAQRLLVEDEVPLSKLASRLGFADQSHFSRIFKQMVGVPPSVFRLQERKKLSAVR